MSNTCSVCGVEKPQTEFPKNGKDKNGNVRYRTDCKECYNITRKLTKKKVLTKFLNNIKHRTGEQHSYTLQDWKDAMIHFRGCCAYCGRKQSRKLRLTKEHVVPVSEAGATSRYNIVPACASCNSSKSDKELLTWYIKKPFYELERLQRIKEWMNNAD